MKHLITLLFGILATEALAKDWEWVGSISLGAAWEDAGETQTFYLAPGIEKTFVASNETESLFNGEVFFGVQKQVSKALQGQLGFAVAFTNNAALSGNIWDDADPNFNNYIYSYEVQHTHVALQGKLLTEISHGFMPWVSVGLGVGWNNAHDYQNTPLIYEALSMPDFKSNTETSFTYTVGVGIQKILNQHWQIGMSYQFADWGKSELDRAPGQTLNSGLSLDHLYTNGVLFNFAYNS